MSTITIDLDETILARFQAPAALLGIKPEEAAKLSIEEFLARPDHEFETIVSEIIEEHRRRPGAIGPVIYLTFDATLRLYDRIIEATGGTAGLRDRAGLESALAQPRMTFGGEELYADLESKASALAYSLIKNHPFVDGNKRIGFAAMDAFLRLNRFRIVATADDVEETIMGVADGRRSRDDLTAWVRNHLGPRSPDKGS